MKCKEREILTTLLVEEMNDGGKESRSWFAGARAVKGFEVICELCNVSVMNVFQSHADVCAELVGSCCQE